MATARRRKNTAVVKQLQQQPQRFEFFQAVRLLELAARLRAKNGEKFSQIPVALGAPPNRESVRFRGQASLAFKGADIDKVEIVETVEQEDSESPQQQWQMLVNIFGLFGSTGILPYHMSELVIQRLRQKDRALVNFLDVLNHRSTSLYYQAWHKYRLPMAYERSHRDPKQPKDIFSAILASLVGVGTDQVNQRLPLPEDSLLGYSGELSRGTPSAPMLARMLCHYFELPITVEQFIGQWQGLPKDIQSRLPSLKQRQGQNNVLGMNAILGDECWEVQSKFRIKIAELSYQEFVKIEPNSDKMKALKAFVRFAVGIEFDFDIEISINRNQIPNLGLGQSVSDRTTTPQMLGWNSALQASTPIPVSRSQLITIHVSE